MDSLQGTQLDKIDTVLPPNGQMLCRKDSAIHCHLPSLRATRVC